MQVSMESNIFRRAALEKLSSPEQLDQMIRVTGPLGWLALVAVAMVLIAVVTWSLVGSISTTVSGSGVILRHGGYRVVATAHPGKLVGFRAAVGDIVTENQAVASIRQFLPDQLPYLEQQVISPCSGRVVEVMANDGDIVAPAHRCLRLSR